MEICVQQVSGKAAQLTEKSDYCFLANLAGGVLHPPLSIAMLCMILAISMLESIDALGHHISFLVFTYQEVQ